MVDITRPDGEKNAELGSISSQTVGSHRMSAWKTAGIIFCCTFAMLLNIAAGPGLTVALPTIGKDLHIVEANLQWVVSSYSLTSGSLLLLFGRLADLHGRRLTFLAGVAWFTLFSIGCGFVHNQISMDVLRALQGLGQAAAIPAAIGILAQSFERGSTIRTIAFATFSSGAPIGAAFGITLGAVLTQLSKPSWRSAFFFTAGLGALTFVIGLLAIDQDTHHLDPNIDRRVDWIGAAIITSGLILFTFAIGDGETAPHGWKTGYIIALLILSVVLIAIFLYWEYVLEQEPPLPSGKGRRAQPLVSLKLFTRAKGRLAVMQTVAFFVWAGFSSWTFYAQLYYQNYLGLTPILSMIRMLPMSVTGVLCNIIVALAVARIQGIILVAFGCIMTGLAPLLFALIKVNSPYWAFGFPSAIVSVFGADFIFASGSIYVAKVSLPHEQSLAAGLFNTLMQLGTSFGLALSSIVLDKTIIMKTRQLTASQPAPSPQMIAKTALLIGYRAVQWLNFGFIMVGLALALVFLRQIGVIARKPSGRAHPETEPKSAIKPIEASKAFTDRTPVTQAPISVDDIGTPEFENPAPNTIVATNKLDDAATTGLSQGDESQARTS